jgi:hypothetical protein
VTTGPGAGKGAGVGSGAGVLLGVGLGSGTGVALASGTGTTGATLGAGCAGSEDDSSFLLSQAATKVISPKRAKIFDMFYS